MSPRFVLGRENVPCVAEVVNRSLKADCRDFSSNLVGRKSKCYSIIKFSLLLSVRLCRREIRPDAGKITEKCVCCKFSLK